MLNLSSVLSKRDIYKRQFTLSVCSSPIVGAYFFGHTDSSSPFQCLFLASTGIPCPGCGLTRSFLAMTHNNVPEAINYHLFGPVLFVGLVILIIHLVIEIYLKRSVSSFYGKLLRKRSIQVSFLFSILGYHAVRLYHLYLSGELAVSFAESPLGQLL